MAVFLQPLPILIALSGFVPNSILRSKFNYTPPVVILKPYQPPNIRQKMIQLEKNRAANLSRSRLNDSFSSTIFNGEQYTDYSESNGEQYTDYSESNDMLVTCISRQLSSRKGQSQRPTASTQKSSYGDYLHPKTAEFGSNFDLNESQYSMTFSLSDFTVTNHSSVFEPEASMGHDIQVSSPDTYKASETFQVSGTDDTSQFSKIEKQVTGTHTKLTSDVQSGKVKDKSMAEERKLSNSQRRQPLRFSGTGVSLDGGHQQKGRTTNATNRKSCDRTHARVQAEVQHVSLPIDLDLSGSELNLNFSHEETAKSFPKRSSSVIFKGNQGAAAAHRNSMNYSIVKLDSLHVVALQKILNSSWYPKDRQTQLQGDSEGLTEVINTLSKLLLSVLSLKLRMLYVQFLCSRIQHYLSLMKYAQLFWN